jgi:thiol:disulfide interchange protein
MEINTLLWNSLLALGAGVILNLMPCVLPVIPFKIQTVMRELKGNVASRLGAAGALLAGSLLFFMLLGGATAYLGLTWGALFQSKLFLTLLVGFLLFSALSVFGNLSVRLPQAIYRLPSRRYTGAFFTGALAGILATPCGGPLLGSVLAYTLTQPPPVVLLIFAFIGIGLALPYVLILMWPGFGDRLARTAPWTPQIKQLMGFGLLAAAIFFSKALMPAQLNQPLWMLLFVGLIVWAGWTAYRATGWIQRVIPLGTLAGAGLIAVSLLSASTPTHLPWQPFSEQSLVAAQTTGQPALIEFTADWCLNCKVLEKTTLTNPEVVAQAKRINLGTYRVDLTEVNDANKKLLAKYGGAALPYVIVMDANGRTTHRFTGIFSANTLKEALAQLNHGEPS